MRLIAFFLLLATTLGTQAQDHILRWSQIKDLASLNNAAFGDACLKLGYEPARRSTMQDGCKYNGYNSLQKRNGVADILALTICTKRQSSTYVTTSSAEHMRIKEQMLADGFKWTHEGESGAQFYVRGNETVLTNTIDGAGVVQYILDYYPN